MRAVWHWQGNDPAYLDNCYDSENLVTLYVAVKPAEPSVDAADQAFRSQIYRLLVLATAVVCSM
jgi:hypothetical protein